MVVLMYGGYKTMLTKMSLRDSEPELPTGNIFNPLIGIPVVLHGQMKDILCITDHWRIHIDKIGIDMIPSEENQLYGTIPMAN